MVLNTLAGVMVARHLQSSGRGLLALAIQIPGTASSIAALGLPTGIVIAANHFRSRIGKWPISGYLLLGIATLCVVSASLLLAFSGGSLFVGQSQLGRAFWSFYVCAAGLSSLTGAIAVSLLRANSQVREMNAALLVNPLVYLISSLVLIGITRSPAPFAVANLLGSISTVLVCQRAQTHSRGSGLVLTDFDPSLMKYVTRQSLIAYPGLVLSIDVLALDVMFLGRYSSPHDLGIYATALSVASLVRFQAVAASNVLLSRMARARTARLKAVLATSILALGTAILMLPIGTILVPIAYGDEFRIGPGLLLVVLLGAALSVPRRLLTDACAAIEASVAATGIQVTTTFTLIGLLSILKSPSMLATSLCVLGVAALQCLLLLVMVMRRSRREPAELDISDPGSDTRAYLGMTRKRG